MSGQYSHNTAAGQTAVSRRDFLQQTRLSLRPSARRTKGGLSVCVNCKSSLKDQSEFLERVKVCADCLRVYATIDRALNDSVEQKFRAEKLKELAGLF